MNAKATPNLEFAPPKPPGAGHAWVVAGIAHALLFVALGLATSWKTQPQTAQAEAELWSAVPQAAAPKLQEPPPEPEPAPTPKPVKPAPPPPPAPDSTQERLDAQIALQKKKQEEKKKNDKLKADKEKAEKEVKTKAEKAKTEKEKANKDKQAKEKAAKEAKERDKKQAAEKAAAESKADAERTEAMRQENLKRIQGMAGASGGEKATGTAQKSSGPSASYAARLVGSIKPNITYPGDVVGNPRAEVEVRVAEDGTIQKITIVQKSGNAAWDDAVLRAIDKTKKLPKDSDGRVPPVVVLGFRPSD